MTEEISSVPHFVQGISRSFSKLMRSCSSIDSVIIDKGDVDGDTDSKSSDAFNPDIAMLTPTSIDSCSEGGLSDEDEEALLSIRSISYDMRGIPHENTFSNTFLAPLDITSWSEPDATSFRVRGKNYVMDRKKIPSESSLFQLISVDLVQVEKPIYTGFCTHPDERVQQGLMKEKSSKGTSIRFPPFVFCVNIVIPGPPHYHLLMYYEVDDISLINPQCIDSTDYNKLTPFQKLASKFFFGESDDFRNSTFKLVPRIVQGNMAVKAAVGSTPTIMGRKLTQTYIRTDRFLELIIDVGSSKIATKIVKLAKGYVSLFSFLVSVSIV